jgi:hypothetical protein
VGILLVILKARVFCATEEPALSEAEGIYALRARPTIEAGAHTMPAKKKAARKQPEPAPPSQRRIRPRVMQAFERIVSRNHDLLQRLAK